MRSGIDDAAEPESRASEDQVAEKSIDRVSRAARDAALDIDVVTMPASTRTAAEAAAACRCTVGQIVKSLVFQSSRTGGLVMLLVAGDRQVDLEAAGRAIDTDLTRADARTVREVTGFAIGGVSPLGHKAPIDLYMDPSLLSQAVVWAAAGAPDAVFSVDPHRLRAATSARLLPPDACKP